MKRTFAAIIFAALAIGITALPATASHVPDAGVIQGASADVSKNPAIVCNGDGTWTGTASGGGLGLPILDGTKHGKYRFAGTVQTLLHGTGAVAVCGNLAPVLDNRVAGQQLPGIGAACGMSKGYNGKGKIKWGDGSESQIRKLQWKWSLASAFIITGELDNGFLAGIVSARGTGATCAEKQITNIPGGCAGGKSGNCGAGASAPFQVDVLLVSSPIVPPVNLNDLPTGPKGANNHPIFCKGSADLDGNGSKEYKCPYKTKPKSKPNGAG